MAEGLGCALWCSCWNQPLPTEAAQPLLLTPLEYLTGCHFVSPLSIIEGCGKIADFRETWRRGKSQGRALEMVSKA